MTAKEHMLHKMVHIYITQKNKNKRLWNYFLKITSLNGMSVYITQLTN